VARKSLDNGDPAAALRIIERGGNQSPACRNLEGVCYLRLGQSQRAQEIFEKLLFPKGGSVADKTAPACWFANYATAQILTVNISGALDAQYHMGSKSTIDRAAAGHNHRLGTIPQFRRMAKMALWRKSAKAQGSSVLLT